MALRSFGRATITDVVAAVVAIAAAIASFLGLHELLILACGGLALIAWRRWRWCGVAALALIGAAVAAIVANSPGAVYRA